MSLTDAMTIPAAWAAAANAPGDPVAQRRLGLAHLAAGQPVTAIALLRTAQTLGDAFPAGQQGLDEAYAMLGTDVLASRLDHNRYHRLGTLAAHLRRVLPHDGFSVLDIGGGDGALALFLPQSDYALAEPDTNGLTGQDLPFPAASFDVVCACHVLEHVPPAERDGFLDSLMECSRGPVVLLGPFAAAGGRHEERLSLMLDITGAPWAREHLECGLPELAEVADYARRRDLACDAEPDHAMPAAMLLTLLDHYARAAGRAGETARVHAYFNSLPPESLVCPQLPAAWRITLNRR